MELVMQHSKYTGKKKPLSSLVTEATLPKGGVLLDIIVRLGQQSNLVTSKQFSILQDCKNINLNHYMLILFLKKTQYIDSLIDEDLVHRLTQSAKVTEN